MLYRGCAEGAITSAALENVCCKVDAFPVRKGDVLHYITWGGGGWGQPHKRDAVTVQRDVRRGLFTVDGAKLNYGVVLSGAALDVDEAATKALRGEMERSAPEGRLFDFKWKEGIRATQAELDALRASCKAETGFEAPKAWKK